MPGSFGSSEMLFDSSDVEILSSAVFMMPNLEYACYAAKLANVYLQFPLQSYLDLAPLFQIDSLPDRIKERGLDLNLVERFLPEEFFPIADHLDLVGKTLAALTWGDTIHYHERFLQDPENRGRVNCIAGPGYQEV